MTKETFLNLLENFPPEKETSCQIKDSINLYDNYQTINLVCHVCGKEGHYARICPNIHLTYNKEELIQQHILEHNKFCQAFQRSETTKRFHAVTDSKHIEARANKFCEENFDLIKGLLGMRRLRMASEVLKKNRLKGLSRLLVKLNSKKLPLSLTAFLKENEKRLSKMTLDELESPIHPVLQTNNSQRNEIDEILEQEENGEEGDHDEDSLSDDNEYYEDRLNKYRYPYRRSKHLVKRDVEIFSDDFDMVRNYQIYFPHNNVNIILQNIEQQELKKQKRDKLRKEAENVRFELSRVDTLSRRQSVFSNSPASRGGKIGLKSGAPSEEF